MEKSRDVFKLDVYMEILYKRRWYVILPFCAAMLVGIYFAFTLPRIYQASTTILIEPQRVPSDYVQSLVTDDINSRINTISQQILSRTNLEKIMSKFDLYSGPEYSQMLHETKIRELRSRISIEVIKQGRKKADAFTLSISGAEPDKAAQLANALAAEFINENMKVREALALGTSSFLDDELDKMRKRLVEVELKMKEYREKNMGGLPEQLNSNLRILDRLQQTLTATQQRLGDSRDRLIVFDNQVAAAKAYPTDENKQVGSNDPEQLRQQLENMLTRYTDKHPDVIRLKKTIADLEARIAKEPPMENGSQRGLTMEQLRTRNDIEKEIEKSETEIARLTRQISYYESMVENTPKKEQELLSLRRDYENINRTYNSLLARKLESELSVSMERKQKGEQFQIIDPARTPEIPIKPDMRKLFVMAVAGGLGIGGGLIFLFEFLNSAFRRPEDVETVLGLTVLATIPQILHPRDKLKNRVNFGLSIVTTAIALLLFVGLAFLTFAGNHELLTTVRQLVQI